MDDLEMKKLCAEAIGMSEAHQREYAWNPLHEADDAMALEDWLIERGELSFRAAPPDPDGYRHRYLDFMPFDNATYLGFATPLNNPDRRHAVVQCVAKVFSAYLAQPSPHRVSEQSAG